MNKKVTLKKGEVVISRQHLNDLNTIARHWSKKSSSHELISKLVLQDLRDRPVLLPGQLILSPEELSEQITFETDAVVQRMAIPPTESKDFSSRIEREITTYTEDQQNAIVSSLINSIKDRRKISKDDCEEGIKSRVILKEEMRVADVSLEETVRKSVYFTTKD